VELNTKIAYSGTAMLRSCAMVVVLLANPSNLRQRAKMWVKRLVFVAEVEV
jgi:broad-specificity NMP kinase